MVFFPNDFLSVCFEGVGKAKMPKFMIEYI